MGPERDEVVERRGRPSEQATGSAAVHEDLSQRLADLAREMQRQGDNASVMGIIVAAVRGAIPGAEEASISLTQGRRRVVSSVATSELARRFDDLQQETGQGPALDAMYEHETIRVDDLTGDGRWPLLGRRAAEIGVASALCFQLFVAGEDLGALNLLARQRGAFTDESERVGLLYASHAAVAVAQAQKLGNLDTALVSRDVIGQAKGVLMERYKITAEQAFALLARTSQDTNRKLSEVAEYLTRTGALESARRRRGDADPAPRGGRERQDGG
ncbi:GAF and ANTAR domain-containing protein [Geodermatophilus sp. SYSU D00815]